MWCNVRRFAPLVLLALLIAAPPAETAVRKKSGGKTLQTTRAKGKTGKAQPELSFERGPRGKFEGAPSSLFEGEDLDVPAFLRKKR